MQSPSAVMTDFISVQPKHLVDQATLLDWTLAAHDHAQELLGQDSVSIAGHFRRFGVKSTLIQQRGLDISDFTHRHWPEMQIYGGTTSPHGRDIEARAGFFLERSREVLTQLYSGAAAPSHLIHVTCTGYASPSAAQRLVVEKGWSRSTDVTHAYHMGCYAALPAVRMAEAFSQSRAYQSKNPRIDIVHTEICSLHMNPTHHTPEQIVVQTLFGDGHIKYSIVPESLAENGFKLKQICEQVIPDSAEDMSWIPSSWGMKMSLSRKVPEKLTAALRPFLERLAHGSGLKLNTLLESAIFAIHPGGPKIIQLVESLLSLKDSQIAASKKVLFERGNMSSATLPHIWQGLLGQSLPSETLIVSLAFGPGLTVFGALFEVL
jgi:predicted naringenin-chalcone synthase